MIRKQIDIDDIVKVVIIVCGNPFKFHEEVYVRYVILIDKKGQDYWMEDPTEEQVVKIVHDTHPNCKKEAITANCPFCNMHQPLDS